MSLNQERSGQERSKRIVQSWAAMALSKKVQRSLDPNNKVCHFETDLRLFNCLGFVLTCKTAVFGLSRPGLRTPPVLAIASFKNTDGKMEKAWERTLMESPRISRLFKSRIPEVRLLPTISQFSQF